MRDDDQELVRHIRTQPEKIEQDPIAHDRNRRPVLPVRSEEVSETAAVALRKETPLIADEPVMVGKHEQDDRQRQSDVDPKGVRSNPSGGPRAMLGEVDRNLPSNI
jgi:hypothetical protein